MALGQLDRGESNGDLFKLGCQPIFVEQIANDIDFVGSCWPKVEVGGNACADGVTHLVDRGELKPLRNHMRLADTGRSTILNAVLEQENRGERIASLGIIDKDCTLPHDLVILFPDQTYDRLKQWMPGADERRNWLLVDLALLKANALILLLNGSCRANLTISLTNSDRDISDLPSTLLTALNSAAKVLEGLNKKALNMMRLKSQRFSSLHIESKLVNLCRWHRVIGERPAA